MSLTVQRILVFFTAVAVLVMNVECACAGGMSAMGPASRIDSGADAKPMPCCAHHHGAAHHCSHEHDATPQHQPNPCNGSCEHCGQTVIDDTVAAPTHSLSLLTFVSPIAANVAVMVCGIVLSPPSLAPIPADLPPPLTSTTLLSLHCALTN